MYVAQCHEPWPVSGQGPFRCTVTDTQDINRQDGLCTAACNVNGWTRHICVQSTLTAKHGHMCMMEEAAGVHEEHANGYTIAQGALTPLFDG